MSRLSWLRDASDPIQFVALAQELDRAVSAEAYITTVPIGFDASCSGLQHYSLLTRDLLGAQMTNLAPPDPDTPLDIYRRILHRLQIAWAAAAKEDERAQWCLEVADRAICKMLVMTYCYSSDEDGQRMQIYEELFDRGFRPEYIPKGAPQYLMKMTRSAIEYELRGGAPAVMNYLKDIARALLWCGEPVRWTSPSGLPVSNLYLEPNVKTVQQHLAGKIKRHDFSVGWKRKHREQKTINAIAPNLIHSLDASHLAFVANRCARERIPLATIHDSYAVLPPHADRLNTILREELVSMYEEHDPLRQIHDYASSITQMLPPLPPRGNLDLSAVRNSPYAFAP